MNVVLHGHRKNGTAMQQNLTLKADVYIVSKQERHFSPFMLGYHPCSIIKNLMGGMRLQQCL